jgi:hypothetical protein
MAPEAAGRGGTRTGLAPEDTNLARLATERILSLTAGEQLAERGARFVLAASALDRLAEQAEGAR